MKACKLMTAAMLVAAACQTMTAAEVPAREHRALWISPELAQSWPSGDLSTQTKADSQRRALSNRLNKFKDQNINIIYFHARNNCATVYPSQYEPWSAKVAGARGTTPAAADVLQMVVEEAHKRGIEVYAWVNPYRYTTGTSKYGDGDKNYETTHPDWLLYNGVQYVLNPGIEAVKQRTVDVIKEIVTNYDVDGVVFDDYFYGSGSTANSLDAAQYNAYKSAGGTLAQADWRRANINEMVHRVNTAIKAIKPWCAFAISPAGVASPPTVTSVYGLQPYSGGSDWQYNGIYSDPLAWYKAGDIDFMSPQIYWPGQFDNLSAWWQTAAQKFSRHCYPSISITDLKNVHTAEYIREVEQTRENSPQGTAGAVFFDYGDFVNYNENIYGKSQSFGDNVHQGAYPTKALTPLRPWNNTRNEELVTNLHIDGNNLVWNAAQAGRYTVYAYPKTETAPFGGGVQYLHGIIYGNSYELPSDAANYDWFVAVYDRYGNEYSPVSVGGTIGTAVKPSLTYPANGSSPVDLFDFAWSTGTQHGLSTIEVATDANFANIIGTIQSSTNTASVTALPALTPGAKYWWRVRFVPVNAPAVVSDPSNFTASRIAISAPTAEQTGLSITPTITWTAASQGAEYNVEVASQNTFGTYTVFSQKTSSLTASVPARTLCTGSKYYVRVTASKNDASSTSEVVTFTTVDKSDYAAPQLISPATDGMTLHCNEKIQIAPYDGLKGVVYQIASTNTFPSRSSFSETLSGFATEGKELGNIKLSSKNLVDGNTYYVRARGSYSLSNSTATKYTDYCAPLSFVYSEQAGVNDIVADEPVGADAQYFTLQGVAVSADNLTPGIYIARSGAKATKVVIR